MSRTWFTADSHFGHANILKHCARPFADAAEMDEALIARWNGVIGRRDEVWCVGDFCFRGTKSPSDYLRRLNGKKHLVWGNHDSDDCRNAPEWTSSQAYAEVKAEGTRLVLFHYGMRVWNSSFRGALHLYGHSHGQLPGDRQSCDVGVDAWGFRPVSLAEIRERLAGLPERFAA